MIPKKIAFFWSGGPLSWLRYMTLKTFCAFNPTWEIHLYLSASSHQKETWGTPETQDFINYSGMDWMPEVQRNLPVKTYRIELPPTLDPVHQCDMFQWWWLGYQGGWYSDLDILYLQPMDKLVEDSGNSDMVFSLPCGDFTIGFLGSNQENKFYQTLYSLCHQWEKARLSLNYYQSFGTQLVKQLTQRNRGAEITNKIAQDYEYSCYVTNKNEDVYPWNWRGINKIWNESHEFPNTQLGIHWYAGARISQDMNSKLTPDNFTKYPCTFTDYLATVI
tara:strand:- start:3225 stop:4052 length:828 start_codon:yes stop_codon:yes gene_type:complete